MSNTTTKSTQSGLVETIAVDPNREHDIRSIDTSCDLVITILLSHIDDIRFWSVLSFSVDFAEETCLTANVIACMAGVTSKRGRVTQIRARGEGRGNACKNPIIFFFQPSPNKNTKSHGGSVQCETKTESPEEKQFKGLKDQKMYSCTVGIKQTGGGTTD